MANPNLLNPTHGTNQVTTTELGPSGPIDYPDVGLVTPIPAQPGTATASPAAASEIQAEHKPLGVEGEDVIWEGRYSMRNFLGRGMARVVGVIAWVALASYTFGYGHENLETLTWILGAVVLLWTVALGLRMFQAHYSHFYRLTNRRLFVSSGIFHRRRDQMELLSIKDVFTRQLSLFDRWLGLGTVVVVSSEQALPTIYLSGVDDPKAIMDLVWHHARAERDQNSVKINHV